MRKLIIEGNTIYEIDEECMVKKEMKNSQKSNSVEAEEIDEKKGI